MTNNTITSILTSTIVALFFMAGFSYFTAEKNEPGGNTKHHLPVQSSSKKSHESDVVSYTTLQESIFELVIMQQQLIAQNKTIQQKIVSLESRQHQQPEKTSNIINSNNFKPVTNASQDERDTTYENGFSYHFDELWHQNSYEEYDSGWASDMEVSFVEIEQRLQSFNMESTTITSRECRSQSCVVEFTHQEGTDQTLVIGILAANGAREVIFKHIQEGDTKKTLAIYMR